MMRRVLGLLAIVSVAFLIACGSDDGDGGITQEQRELRMGESSGSNILFSGLASPLVLARNDVHSNVRDIDLNNDGVDDVSIRAYEEFAGDKGLTFSTLNDSTRVSVVNNQVKPLSEGDIITIDSESWGSAESVVLAELISGTPGGNWNGLGRRYIAIRMDIGIRRFLAWIEISVEEYDNYSFYNVALKSVP